MKKVGLLVMAYGTPASEADIERYYSDILGGRTPRPQLVEELTKRYQQIGGISPLGKITREQTAELARQLNEQSEVEFVPYLGQKHTAPFIEDAVRAMAMDGIETAVAIILAPHYSRMSIQTYHDRVLAAAKEFPQLQIHSIRDWYHEEAFIQYWADAVNAEMAKLTDAEKETAIVLFSAHSLPEKILEWNDPYPAQIKETAQLIAEAAGIKNFQTSWQSAGRSLDPWLGPDIQDYTKELYREKGYRSFIYAPVGFVAEHLEVLFDNDFECRIICDAIGAKYLRAEMPNANPQFISAMASAVLKSLESIKSSC